MILKDYIKGNRKGRNANRLEKESMRDPFLGDALDGFDAVEDDHIARINAMHERLVNKKVNSANKHQTLWKIVIAASVIFIALIGKVLIIDTQEMGGLQAQNIVELPIDIYVPEIFYQENIAIIAQKNTELTKDLSIVTNKKRKNGKDENISTNSSEDSSLEPINIYIPTDK